MIILMPPTTPPPWTIFQLFMNIVVQWVMSNWKTLLCMKYSWAGAGCGIESNNKGRDYRIWMTCYHFILLTILRKGSRKELTENSSEVGGSSSSTGLLFPILSKRSYTIWKTWTLDWFDGGLFNHLDVVLLCKMVREGFSDTCQMASLESFKSLTRPSDQDSSWEGSPTQKLKKKSVS